MEAEKSFTFRLETYLVQLADINRRWTEWLKDSETAALAKNSGRPRVANESVAHEIPTPAIAALEITAKSLFAELQQAILNRQQLLSDAQQAGLAAPDLTTLARQLPAWEKPALRQSLAVARGQLANLRRLHFASWVLISQVFHYYNDSLQLLMVGNTPHVYQQGRQTDTGGGRLLDASL